MANPSSDLPTGEPAGPQAQAAGATEPRGDESAAPQQSGGLDARPGAAEPDAPANRVAGDAPSPVLAEPSSSRQDSWFPPSEPSPVATPSFPVAAAEPEPASSETLNQVLSQSEVERLLSEVQAEDARATVIKPGGETTRLKHEEIQPCDFRQPAFLTSGELRKLRLRHEEFIRSLAAHLSIYLRLEVVISMSKLQTLAFQKYVDALPNPTHLTQFKVEPLKGICLLDMSPRLGLTFVDRLLGGPAHSVSFNGELSEIEAALLDQVATQVLKEWCALWQKVENTRPVILGHESNGRFLATAAHDTVMLLLAMEVRVGDCVEQMQLAFPFMTIEPLVRHSSQASELEADASRPQGQLKWNAGFDEVPVQIHAQWQGVELTGRALSNLKCGDILPLDANCFERVEIRLEQVPKFYARLGTSGEHWAVELTEPAKC